MADAIFELPRLAAIYDALEPDRSDLEAYEPSPTSSVPAACWTWAAGQGRSQCFSPVGDST